MCFSCRMVKASIRQQQRMAQLFACSALDARPCVVRICSPVRICGVSCLSVRRTCSSILTMTRLFKTQ
jgi:hypothetical protein